MGTINTVSFLVKLRWKIVDCILFPVLDWCRFTVKLFVFQFFYTVYNDFVGLRVSDGKVCAAAMLPMQTFAFEEQRASIDEMKKKPWARD